MTVLGHNWLTTFVWYTLLLFGLRCHSVVLFIYLIKDAKLKERWIEIEIWLCWVCHDIVRCTIKCLTMLFIAHKLFRINFNKTIVNKSIWRLTTFCIKYDESNKWNIIKLIAICIIAERGGIGVWLWGSKNSQLRKNTLFINQINYEKYSFVY